MRVFVEPSGRRIAPFDDPPGEALIGNRRLADRLDDALRGAGLTRVEQPEPPCLVLPDTLWTTAGALRKFLAGAAGRDAVLVLAHCRFADATTPVQPHVTKVAAGFRFEKIRFVSGADAEPVEVVIDPEEDPFDVPAPPYLDMDSLAFGLPRDVVMTLHHWVHILWANQAAGGIELMRTPPWKWALRGLWAATRARPPRRAFALGGVAALALLLLMATVVGLYLPLKPIR